MKRFISLFYIFILALKLVACSPAEVSEGDYGDCYVAILDPTLSTSENGYPCITVNIEYTNNSDEPESFFFVADVKAFQNDTELDDRTPNLELILVHSGEVFREIQDGATITVDFPYVLNNENDEVTIKVTPKFRSGSTLSKIITLVENK